MLASVSLSPSQDKARATTHMWLLTQFGLHIKTIETTMPTAITHEKWHFHPTAVFFTSHWTDSMNNAVCRQLTWSKSKSQSELVISCRQQLHNFIKIQIIQSINLWSHNPIRLWEDLHGTNTESAFMKWTVAMTSGQDNSTTGTDVAT